MRLLPLLRLTVRILPKSFNDRTLHGDGIKQKRTLVMLGRLYDIYGITYDQKKKAIFNTTREHFMDFQHSLMTVFNK